jgi:hypothetical protein
MICYGTCDLAHAPAVLIARPGARAQLNTRAKMASGTAAAMKSQSNEAGGGHTRAGEAGDDARSRQPAEKCWLQ